MYEENFCIKRIKELMENNNFNAYRLAKQSGIALSTLTSMFEKNTDPRIQTIEKICSACGISVAQFFDYTPLDLTEEQQKLITLYMNLSPDKRKNLMSYLEWLAQPGT